MLPIWMLLAVLLATAGAIQSETDTSEKLELTNPTQLSVKNPNSNSANRAIDGNTNSYYQSLDSGDPTWEEQWVQFDLVTPSIITRVVIVDR